MSSPIRPEGSKRAEAASAAAAPETNRAEARAAAAAQEALPAAGSKRRPPETLARESKGARTEPLHLIKAHGRDARGRLLSDCFNEVLGFLPITSITAVACTEKSTLQGVREGAVEAKKIVHLRALRHLEKIVRSYAAEVPEDLAAKEAFLYTLSNEIVEWRASRRESFPKDTSAVFDTCQTLVTKAFFLPTDLLRAIVDAPIVDSHIKNGLATIKRIMRLRELHDNFLANPRNEDIKRAYLDHTDNLLNDVVYRNENGHLGNAILQYFKANHRLKLLKDVSGLIAQCYKITNDLNPAQKLHKAEPQPDRRYDILTKLLKVARDTKQTELGYNLSRVILRRHIGLLSESDEAIIDDVVKELVKAGKVEKAHELVLYGLNFEGWNYVDCCYCTYLGKHGYVDHVMGLLSNPLFGLRLLDHAVRGLAQAGKFNEALSLLDHVPGGSAEHKKDFILANIFNEMLRQNKYISAILLVNLYPDLVQNTELYDFVCLRDYECPEDKRFEVFEAIFPLRQLSALFETDEQKALFYINALRETHSGEVTSYIFEFFMRYGGPLNEGSLRTLCKEMCKRLDIGSLRRFLHLQLTTAPKEKHSPVRSSSLTGLLERDDHDMRLAFELAKDLPKKMLEKTLFFGTQNLTVLNILAQRLVEAGRVDMRSFEKAFRQRFVTSLFVQDPSAHLYCILPELENNVVLAEKIVTTLYSDSRNKKRAGHLAAIQFTTKYISGNHEVQDALYASILKDAIGRKGINIYPLIAAIPEGKRKETLLATIDCVY